MTLKDWCIQNNNDNLLKEWHPTKNDFGPDNISSNSKKKVWWMLHYKDTATEKEFDFEWQATVEGRTKGYGCPYLSGKAVWAGFNDLATVNPELATEWHPTQNGSLTPQDVTANSNKKVWWQIHHKDPVTGNYVILKWEETIANRNQGNGCPYLSGHAVCKGFNDLATLRPDIAAQWHPTKNGDLKPEMITINSNKKVWWFLPYDDPDTGKHFDFEWYATVSSRVKFGSCPYLSGRAVYKGFNDLATVNPGLAAEWHPTKNGDLTPYDVTAGSNKKIWWFLPYDNPETGEHFDFEWQARITDRNKGSKCPFV